MVNPWDSNYMEDVDAVTQAAPVEKPRNLKPWENGYSNTYSGFVQQKQPEKEKTDPVFESRFMRLIEKESAGRQFDKEGNILTSNKGAQGVTQVMPKTAKNPGYGVEPMKDQSRKEFIRFGRDYLKAMLNEFEGDWEKSLAAYNAGPGNVKKAIRKAGEEGDWKRFLPKKSETLPYIDFIMSED